MSKLKYQVNLYNIKEPIHIECDYIHSNDKFITFYNSIGEYNNSEIVLQVVSNYLHYLIKV